MSQKKGALRTKRPKYGPTQAARVWMHDAEILANEIMRPTYTGFQWYPYLILQNERGQKRRPVCGRACMKERETMEKLQNARCDRQLRALVCFLMHFLFQHCQPARCLLSLLTSASPDSPL